ncbi:MAG: alpha/beta fold hydrolase [Bacteroidales bacterium]|nr:alpha/beta fold hydrolase [Bacteroidales bacterium]
MRKRILMAVLMLCASLHAAAQTGTWSGKLDVQGTKLTIVFHLDGEEPCMDSPDQAAMGIPIQVERTGMGGITIKIPMLGASFEGQWMIRQIVGTFRQMTLSAPLTLTPEKPLNRPQTPREPFPYAQEEVSFSNGDATLAGTLVLPEGYSRKTPVLIMVTGSGQEDRDETIFEHKPFAVIADALGRAGIATLRCDDRGVGGSTGEVLNATTLDFKDDALAGIRLLRERFDKVGVIGHSEGGLIALMLAADKQADFIVSLAGVAVSGIELYVAQTRTAIRNAGYPEDQVETLCKAVGEAAYVKVHGGRMPFPDELDLPDDLKQVYQQRLVQMSIPWMSKLLSLDMRQRLGDITCPVLALNGTKDTQVDYESNLEALRNGLPSNPRNRIEALEGLNHLFQHCTTGGVPEYRTIEETFSPEALDMIVRWVSGLK